MKSTVKIFVFVIVLSVFCMISGFGQGNSMPTDSPSLTKSAQQVLDSAKNLVYKNRRTKDVRGLLLKIGSDRIITQKGKDDSRTSIQTTLSIRSLSELRSEEYVDFRTNQQLVTEILNTPKYSFNSDVLVDGQPFHFGSNLSKLVPTLTKDQRIRILKQKIFRIIFPMILQTSWYQGLASRYLGEAESKDGRADVVEITYEENKKFQLFFDKKSHLLLMMTEKIEIPSTNKELEIKSYYSDYKDINGLLLANTVIVQTGEAMTEERKITKLEIDPTFKSKVFEVKQDKINLF